jgi:CBS domain containing-hemolysin-like protein
MSGLGRIPRVGDEVPLDGAVLRVERMDGRRIDRVRLVDAARPIRVRAGDRS